ncbi:MAG TPA: UDP-N-acetylmuramate dehydrogenase [Flavobacteriaceae bacterium]|nr:UDP-N-acetylmuramate dehydrogenase [Flavobacteriaceae bacterium]MCB9213600.1 UDP-N-acetylmuramate dehydrogenase [Alteromonas sp.]HPF12101.1 UDP-N-acetylmuramate dehydrogenase [Flavobacteriaceae bacterium]HQU21468.1 UDP-N-acetylmuramate dehydrogenase [Flavobacteriaceae bacterium]HQU65618.1 UDP-N-acetylmuramate dehydrogenase [Flavobacteriaceae bacterium]
MPIEADKSLKHLNTFGIDCKARRFVTIKTKEDLKAVLATEKDKPLFILGGGSNMLLTKDIDALVLHIDLKGISVVSENESEVIIEAQAGENWHQLVQYCLKQDWGGIENLSLIPGNVGAAPIQNIGAYGVELQDVFVSCEALHIVTQEEKRFFRPDCQFGYRESIFKKEAKGAYIITSVQLRLSKKEHLLHMHYGALQKELKERGLENPTIQDIAETVIQIRKSKLPDPNQLGNSGSFFKNPVIDLDTFQSVIKAHPEAPFYEVSATEYKIPAGWLIEKAGYKGRRFGDAGVHDKQALVLVNHGNATGKELWELALRIQQTVKDQFGIFISPEVNVY